MIAALPLTRIPEEDEALRSEVREFLETELRGRSVQSLARSWMQFDEEFTRKLARRGWVGLTIPQRYGGGGRSQFARLVLCEELLAAGAPVAAHWFADRQSAPLILRYGTEAQRQYFLPRICRGELFVAVGMSEPGTGSDLASVQTRADRIPGGWRIRGTKIWTSNAHRAHYVIALVRSSGSAADRHRGLSQFAIPLEAAGVTVKPIVDLNGDAHFNEVFFDDVHVPEEALIGVEGQGWEQVNAELAFERSGPERILSDIVLVEQWLGWLRTRRPQPDASIAALGRIAARLGVLRQLSIALTARLAAGDKPLIEAALLKDLGTTTEQEIPEVIAALLGSEPGLEPPAELLDALRYVAHIAPAYSLRGGTREILRGVIARGLGLR